jgi:hypothetical protein
MDEQNNLKTDELWALEKRSNQLNSTAILIINRKIQKNILKIAEFQGFFGIKNLSRGTPSLLFSSVGLYLRPNQPEADSKT